MAMTPLAANATTVAPVTGTSPPILSLRFWVPLAPGRSFDGRAMVLGIPRVNVKKGR